MNVPLGAKTAVVVRVQGKSGRVRKGAARRRRARARAHYRRRVGRPQRHLVPGDADTSQRSLHHRRTYDQAIVDNRLRPL